MNYHFRTSLLYQSKFELLKETLNNQDLDTEQTREDQLVELLSLIRDFSQQNGLDFQNLLDQANFKKISPPTYLPVQLGKVTFFNPNSDRNFGFINNQTFFHQDNGIVLCCDGSPAPAQSGLNPRQASKHDQLVYQQEIGKKGPKTIWWAFKNNYDQVLLEIDRRPAYRLKRLGTDTTLWQGRDLNTLRFLYPLAWHKPKTISDASLYYFEIMQNDQWQPTTDPRMPQKGPL